MSVRKSRVIGSALWGAWADALGFVTELVDKSTVERRALNCENWPDTIDWSRRVGGKFGPTMRLPRGTYSDDTQLRLAVGRSISAAHFDVDAFARVELTIWPSYALGGGRASKAAAKNLARSSTRWFTNFYDGYFDAGGNGAAMRVQPHIWSLEEGAQIEDGLMEVLVDAITTHGHPRALVGAVLHAAFLHQAIQRGTGPNVEDFEALLAQTENIGDLAYRHPDLQQIWIPAWEDKTGQTFRTGWTAAVEECRHALMSVASLVGPLSTSQDRTGRGDAYLEIVKMLGIRAPSKRGSGTLTAVAACALSAAFPRSPRLAAETSALCLGTDTDTIGTMAASISGVAAESLPEPESLQDWSYIRQEASRLNDVSVRKCDSKFPYPDLLAWTPPQTQLDAVLENDDGLVLDGLGQIRFLGVEEVARVKNQVWQWVESEFGPTFLVKRREFPRGSMNPQPQSPLRSEGSDIPGPRSVAVEEEAESSRSDASRLDRSAVSAMLTWVAHGQYDARRIAYAMVKLANLVEPSEYARFALRVREGLLDRRTGATDAESPDDPGNGIF